MKRKGTITWVTPDYYVDCDFNPELFSGILEFYDIHWLILLPVHNARFHEDDFEAIKKIPGIKVNFFYWKCRARSPKMLIFFENVYRFIKRLNSDLIYFNYSPENPYVLPLYWRLNKRRTIVTAHDGNVKSSFSMPKLSKIAYQLAFRKVVNVHLFSNTQELIFKSNFNNVRTFVIPLALKNFGKSTLLKRRDSIGFLFLGSIHSNKNLELLINAACNLHEKNIEGFKISINGYCTNWDFYESQIRYPELFECNIRMFKNSEIPDLLSLNHYMVFPYSEMSQSGALKVAFNYNIPVIASNLEAFKDEIKHGVNGFTFQSNNVIALENLIIERLKNHALDYASLQEKCLRHNKACFSIQIFVNKYVDMFNEVLSNQQKSL
jgi:glycosyltransferase involved in cell wall biosynthesis